jgi:S-adenosylmethionine hydrolase
MTVICLLTDFGLRDGYPGVMKGVILGIAPAVQIVDLSHEIPPQDVQAAALTLYRSVRFFPGGTIFVAVVDPGVGTARRAIVAKIGSQYFVGPDNGIFSVLLAEAEDHPQPVWIGELNQPDYWLPVVSRTFHGRDIFAPVAAHLAAGVPVERLSTQIDNPVRLELPEPVKTTAGWIGQVIHIDHFGNLSTNIEARLIDNLETATVVINRVHIEGLVTSFGEQPIGTLVALIDSSGSLAISVVNGSASRRVPASVGDPVELRQHA